VARHQSGAQLEQALVIAGVEFFDQGAAGGIRYRLERVIHAVRIGNLLVACQAISA
jgi:predicted nucleic acid-binding protein